jgi:glucosamine kinase
MTTLIADSGSTKCDWALITADGRVSLFQSPGINPSTGTLVHNLIEESGIKEALANANNIHFYGAGVVDHHTKMLIAEFLKAYTNTDCEISINEDMLAAARACLHDKSGFVGILGTGSNSCFYDGVSTFNIHPSLGYLISDEGGGTRLGVAVLKAYFYKQMPEYKAKEFEEKFEYDKSKVIYNLYKTPQTNRYLASFATLLDSDNDEWSRKVIAPHFEEFINLRIKSHPDWFKDSVHFVGSIAFLHRELLKATCDLMNIECGSILKAPMPKLIEYHRPIS